MTAKGQRLSLNALRLRWRRFRRDLPTYSVPRGLLPAVLGTGVISSAVIIFSAVNSEHFKNDLLTDFVDEKLHQIAKSLEAETLDWAVWNETYNHIRGRNPDYYNRQYNQYSFARTPFVAAFDAQGQLHSSATWDFNRNHLRALTTTQVSQLLKQIPAGSPLAPAVFLGRFEDRPFLFSLQPVVPTHSDAPPVGRLMFVRPLDERDVSFKDSPTLNRALGVSREYYGVARPGETGLLAPIQVSVPLQTLQGVSPMPYIFERPPTERWQAIQALAALWTGSVLVATLLLGRSYCEQRRLRLMECLNRRSQQQMNRALQRRQEHDELTGLLSEIGLRKAIDDQARRYPEFIQAVVQMDLDHFSLVNNGLGRSQGDRLLQLFSEHLRECVHDTAAVSRLGADQFACSLVGTSEAALRSEISELNRNLNSQTVSLDGKNINLSVSLGAAFMSSGDPEKALHEASIACSIVKMEGGHRYQIFGDAMATTSSYLAIQKMNQELVTAIREQRIVLFGQNAWLLTSGDELPSVYVELLCRIRDPETGKLYWHEKLIDAANVSGSLPLLDQTILELAVADIAALKAESSDPELVYAINITPETLLSTNFPQCLDQLCDSKGIDTDTICLEITEQAALRSPAEAIATMKKLRKLGFSLSLDDFGTGMTSLGYLRDLPLDYVKIDKSFIRKLPQDTASQLIVQFVVELGKEIGFQTIAEGVEDVDLLKMLQRLGISIAQGYVVTRPQPFRMSAAEGVFSRSGAELLACREV